MREPIREPTPQEQRTGRPPEPLRYVGPAAAGEAAPYTVGGLVEWAPTWGGMFVALGVLFLLSALGVAIGVGAGATGVAIWEAISVIIAFFVGGWFAGRTLNLVDSLIAGAHGLLVWAVSMVFALTFLITATLIGVTSFANLTRIPFIAGIIGVTGINVPTAAAATAAVTSSWVTFIFLLLAAAAAIVGALVGNQGRIVSVPGAPRR